MRRNRIEPGALAASIAGHCLLVAAGAWLLATHRGVEVPRADEIAVEESGDQQEPGGGAALGEHSVRTERLPDQPKPLHETNARATPRPDMTAQGRGTRSRGERATNLSSSVDPLTLQRDTPNHLDQSQVQRLRTARRRQSWDDRRATPHPMELDFVASGRGRLALRRPVSDIPPSAGALSPHQPRAVGATPGAASGEGSDGAPGARAAGEAPQVSAGAPGQPSRG
ncbi:MAG TPA: hypothetical protein VFQ35_18320, partial [Polyangiaceae bacterium]|nr:hypothetical protein [Polyangiaceae bacterium]